MYPIFVNKGDFMTITLLDLYNTAATQEWSMYDNDAASKEEFEKSLVLSLNKAVSEILYSYPFSFRERTHVIITVPNIKSYAIPCGLIKRDETGNYCVRINSKQLCFTKDIPEETFGIPEKFYIRGDKINFSPTPKEKCIITIEYITLAIRENIKGEEIYSLKEDTDSLIVPPHLEELVKNAIISRTMLNSIASEGDENYSAYKKQSETAYRLLIKYSKGVGLDKAVTI